jgi:triosephosphate isomerase
MSGGAQVRALQPGYLIVGNWKMNKGPAEAPALADAIVGAVGSPRCAVAICPSFVSLPAVMARLEGSPVALGAQTCATAQSGAFTGEVSPTMLSEVGVRYVILGHSERRQHSGETDASVAARIRAALDAGLRPILCVGESEAQRECGETEALLSGQLKGALGGLSGDQMAKVAVAYEPIWAIGTGKTATEAQAEATCAFIRGQLSELFDDDIAARTPILYGGSMNAQNAAGLLSCPNINGGLVGGASLKPDDFAAIVAAADRLEAENHVG